jgi:dTDP-4-amino-4,6-dideoxygalactose transaminase
MKRPPPSSPVLGWRNLFRSARGTRWATLQGSDRVRFTYSGRAGIYQYLSALRRSRPQRPVVLIPAFHCPTIVDPALHALHAEFDVRFYAIDSNLEIVTDDFLHKLDGRVAAAIFIRYFGLGEVQPRLVNACRDADIRVIEDCAHSFLSANPIRLRDSGADATIYSFWKLIPSQVGGGVLLRKPSDDVWPKLSRAGSMDSSVRLRRFARELGEGASESVAAVLGVEPLKSREREVPVPAVRKPAAEAYPYDAGASKWRMPLTAKLLLEVTDLERVVGVRRRNFETLARTLVSSSEISPVCRVLAQDDCPWGFPVFLRRRSERDYLIRAQGVPVFTFGEVLHPLLEAHHPNEQTMLDAATYLSESVLAFAIHQGLVEAQVESFGNMINDFSAAL